MQPGGRFRALALWAAIFALFGIQLLAAGRLPQRKADTSPELLVSLPRAAQVVMAGGDRNLAANLAGVRVLVADTQRMNLADYAVQARLQEDIAWLNPAHEDNYYIAAALLPWNGQLDAAQFILKRASEKRVFDYQPVFYYAFNYYHFLRDPATAAKLLLDAAERPTDQGDRWAMQNLASRWIERGYQTATAAGIVAAMAASSPPGGFRKYLEARARRLSDLARLKDLAEDYRRRFGRPLRELDELVTAGLIDAIPADPFGQGYALTPDGDPVFRVPPPRGRR